MPNILYSLHKLTCSYKKVELHMKKKKKRLKPDMKEMFQLTGNKLKYVL